MPLKDAAESLKISLKIINEISEFKRDRIEKIFLKEIEKTENKDKGRLLWPLRVALTGLKASPGPFEILEILGKKISMERIEIAIKKLT